VVADPVFDPADARVTAAPKPGATSPPSRRLTRLPFSRDEADRIMALAPPASSLKAVDFEASRALVTGGALRPFRIVHFATHALQDDAHPNLSGIVFSLVDPSGGPRDGFLRLQDMHAVPLDAELVVLSACSTGVAAPNGGEEGLSSLARGLFAARIPSVLSSLWKIDDEATAELMAVFYRGVLHDRQSPAAALRAAQIAMSKGRFRDPYYWSGFVLQGNW
jgi:CHAT domain-containing protein